MTSVDVLLIDDDSILRGFLAQALRLAGYSVLIASSGDIALALLSTHSCRLVITDVLMPVVDGFEIIVHLRKHRPETRILAMSAGGCVGDPWSLLRAATCLGAHRTLIKPFEVEPFLDAVAAVLVDGSAASSAAMTHRHENQFRQSL